MTSREPTAWAIDDASESGWRTRSRWIGESGSPGQGRSELVGRHRMCVSEKVQQT